MPTLLVGAPTEDIGSVANAGTVQPVRVSGASSPLQLLPTITENNLGVGGTAQSGNQLGRSLGALTGRTENILTMSSPFTGTGAVYVLSDATNGSPRLWLPEVGKRFGWAVSN